MSYFLFNPHHKVFIKTINYNYIIYWTLFSYNTEKYYISKNNLLPYSNFMFLKNSYNNNTLTSHVNNIIQLKKQNVSFTPFYKSFEPVLDSFMKINSSRINDSFLDKGEFYEKFNEEEELPETNVWVDNIFKFKTKMLITQHRRILINFFNLKLKRQYRITRWVSNFLK